MKTDIPISNNQSLFRTHARLRAWTRVLLCSFLWFSYALTLHADNAQTEYQVKAAFMYNFAKFVEWPATKFPDKSTPIEFCVSGKDPFGQLLDDFAFKVINGHPIKISRLTSSDAEALQKCHLLFISGPKNSGTDAVAAQLTKLPILSISESPGTAIITFMVVDERVRFLIDEAKAKESHLTISAQLLKLGIKK